MEPAETVEAQTLYGRLILGQVPKLLSMADRNPFSPTYGCFDRGFWHYRTMTDYAAPLYQEAALALVIFSQGEKDGNPYYGSAELEELAIAAMRFWRGLQNRDGSFPEFYPYERSFVATAFTSYAISETLLKLGDRVEESVRDEVLETLGCAADWLHAHRDVVVVNHTAGAIAALQNLFLLTGEHRYVEYREAKIADLLAHQHEEGWFFEYGGADPGYLSLAVDYLAKDYRHSRDERLRQALLKAIEFMRWFMHPDGSYGGEYGSRNAKYLMPHGLEIMATESPAAVYLLQQHYRALQGGKVVSPFTMDDRYSGFFLNKYAEAWIDHRPLPEIDAAEFNAPGTKFFPGAGLLVQREPQAYTVVGMSKHGVVKSYARGFENGALYSDTGYFAVFADGTVGTTQWLNLAVDREIEEGKKHTEIKLSCPMAKVNTSLPLIRLLVPFRIFLRLAGWSGVLMDWFGKILKDRMITTRRLLPLHCQRRVRLESDGLWITDRLQIQSGKPLVRLGRQPDVSALHVASSRYYQLSERGAPGQWQASQECIRLLNSGGILEIITQVVFAKGQVDCKAVQADSGEVIAA